MMTVKTRVESRLDFPALIDELGLKTGVELGVFHGANSNYLLAKSSLEKLYSIDAWNLDSAETMAAPFKSWTVKKGDEVAEAERHTRETLSKHGSRSVIIKGNSFDVAAQFEDDSIDFIYFDAGHRFAGFALDMINWWPKVKMGGVIAGHDYWRRYRYEVMDVANAFLFERRLPIRITWDDKNHKGGGYAPPSFWTIKEHLNKKEFFAVMPQVLADLKEAKAKLAKKGIQVVLPYQYSSTVADDDEEADEGMDKQG